MTHTKDEELKLALEALEYLMTNKTIHYTYRDKAEKAITAIKQARSAPVQEPVAWPCVIAEADFEQNTITLEMQCSDYKVGAGPHWLHTTPPAAQQEPVKLRRGAILRCIETEELCTVWATSTSGKTMVKWSANNFGNYTAEQIGELFWIEPEPAAPVQEPVAMEAIYAAWHGAGVDIAGGDWSCFVGMLPTLYTAPPAAQRPWVGLTQEEIDDFARAIEAKLMEKNT